LSRLGNGERNLAKPKPARPSERARASQTGLWFSPIYDLRFWMDAAKPLIASIVNRISQPSPAGLPRRRQVKPSQAKIQATGQNQTKIKPIQTKKVAAPAAYVALRRAKPGSTHLAASKPWRRRACRVKAKRRRINHQRVIAVHCRPLPLIASYCQPSREDILSSLRPQKAINFSMFSTKSPPFSRCFNA